MKKNILTQLFKAPSWDVNQIDGQKNETWDWSFIFGAVIITIITVSMMFFLRIFEPCGDEILFSYDGALTLYLDNTDFVLGNRIQTLSQSISMIEKMYLDWGGRMMGYFSFYIGILFPKMFRSVLSACIFSFNTILVLRIALKDTRKVIKSPILFCMVYFALYWVRYAIFFMYMWLWVCLYSFSAMLVLLYYNIAVIDMKKGRPHKTALLAILGFFAGFSHEIFSFSLIIMVVISLGIAMLRRKSAYSEIKRHIGLIIGYTLCFFSPGNYNRANQSHSAIRENYLDRLELCVKQHISSLIGNNESKIIFIFIALFCGIAIIFYMLNNHLDAFISIIVENAGVLFTLLLSPFIWAFAPSCPSYNMELWLMLAYGMMLTFIVGFLQSRGQILREYISIIGTVLIMIAFVLLYKDPVTLYAKTAIMRNQIIKQTVEKGNETAIIPMYSDTLEPDKYGTYELNNQEALNDEWYTAYYGSKLVLNEDY